MLTVEDNYKVTMDKLTRGRRPVRLQLMKTVKEVEDLLSSDKPDQKAVRVSSASLEKTATELEAWDTKIQEQLLNDGATDDVVDKEFVDDEKYRRSYLNVKTDLDDFFAPSYSSGGDVETGTVTGDGRKRKFHLPEVKLKIFGGDLKEWLGWWSQFKKIHEDEELHDTDKFQYLAQAMLTGSEAKSIVDSYPQTEGNYLKAVEALQDRFGRQDLLLQVYVRELLTLVIGNVTSTEKLPLSQLFVRLESHLRCLAELSLDKADPATWLFPLVESSLSEETLRAWQRSSQSKVDGSGLIPPKSRLDLLMEFMKSEVQCEQQISLAQQGFSSRERPETSSVERRNKPKPRMSFMKKTGDFPTAAGLINLQSSACGVCGKAHETEKCYQFRRMNLPERLRVVKEKRLCYQCLSVGHMKRYCQANVKCSVCSGSHYAIICNGENNKGTGEGFALARVPRFPPQKKTKMEQQQNEELATAKNMNKFAQSSNQCSRMILMNTIKVNIEAKDGRLITVRMVGDSGSQRSYVTSDIITKAKCAWIEDEWLQNVLFGGQLTAPKRFTRQEVTIKGLNGSSLNLQLLVKDQITGGICEVPQGPWIDELKGQGIVLSDLGDKSTVADILIGNDYWGAIRTGRMVKLLDGLVAEETVFGWTLGGRVPVGATSMVAMSMTVGSQDIEKLWSLEALGIRDTVEVKSAGEEGKQALTHFMETVRRDDRGRYVVALPWRECPTDLPSGRQVAEQRLRATTYKLQRAGKLPSYHSVFQDWEKEGLIVKIPDGLRGGHYVPHRPVFKESATTPVRPVFDASCRVGRGLSINDYLHKGPNLIEFIPVMMLRFGEEEIGVSADIRKAFQMVKVKEADQQFQRFLWWADISCKKIVIYQHTRMVFGFTCSPFLLGAVIQQHLDSLEEKDLASKLQSSFYVDNLVTSVKSREDYRKFRNSSIKIMAEASMELREWASSIPATGEPTTAELEEAKVVPILGMLWDREADTLSCVIKSFIFENITKRNILSVVAQIFDPIGILCPVLVLPKLMVQEAWSSKLGWDRPIPETAEKRFLKWNKELPLLTEVQVPRYAQVPNATTREIHVFSDSSQDAMATVAFLRTELNGVVAVQFLLAKSRLTPVKKPTIPRAELVSCVLGVRIARCIQEGLKLNTSQFTFWSDSSTAITWIQRSGDWGIFVKNRVKEILTFSSANQWRHVPGKMNPADLPSRGCSPAALIKSRWWEGPLWLKGSKTEFPVSSLTVNEQEVEKEHKKTMALMITTNKSSSPPFSSYRKNVAVWGWVIRFIQACKKQKSTSIKFLTIGEMRQAEKILLKQIQSDSFPSPCFNVGGIQVFKDDESLLRVKTRLSNSKDNSEFIYPILLPKSHPLVEMLILDMHLYHSHGGIQFLVCKLREKYWVLQSRRVVRKVINRCVPCRRHSIKNLEVDPAALPSGRVNLAGAFYTTGVDLAGPLFLKDGRKAWVVLYTCALYRALFLDLVTSLSTDAFLKSLERFISIFGRPNTVYSDNGTNFVGAANLFKRISWSEVEARCGVHQIQWVFNPPTAAWWGGWWERLVRSVKDILKRMLGRTKLSEDELRTCLAGVTTTINDRPLTVVSEDNDDLVPLTPSMFIRPLSVGHFPELSEADFMQKSYRRMKDVQARLQHRFRKEYLSLLVNRVGKKQQSSVVVGDVVLIGADNRKRYEWPLGVIDELLPGKDGKVRVVKVRTASGLLTRPLQRIFPLEVSQEQLPVDKVERPLPQVEPERELLTRSGRASRAPVRYGQWTCVEKCMAG